VPPLRADPGISRGAVVQIVCKNRIPPIGGDAVEILCPLPDYRAPAIGAIVVAVVRSKGG
jgi:hypothetical protein